MYAQKSEEWLLLERDIFTLFFAKSNIYRAQQLDINDKNNPKKITPPISLYELLLLYLQYP